MLISHYENLFSQKIQSIASSEDPAHDELHFQRVVATAKALCEEEQAKIEIVLPAAWLHDFVIIPKNDSRRKQASRLSAEAAVRFLQEIEYPSEYFEDIAHAIEAHSFSANIETKTLEAKIVQDADRLDGLGAIGVARCFATAGLLKRPFYSAQDSFCLSREPNDQIFTVDHFYAKLFKTAETLKTSAARREGQRRVEVMKKYLEDLKKEIGN
ncbi:MAG: HD domain-containing protein [Bdellovibrionales bacterium]